MASCADSSSSAAQLVSTNCASTRNDSNSFWIGERQERARPPPAMELTNTLTPDLRRMEEASARSFMQLFLSHGRWNHVSCFSIDSFRVCSCISFVGVKVEHTTFKPVQ